MFTMLILWATEFQFPDWCVPVAAVIGFVLIGAAIKMGKKN